MPGQHHIAADELLQLEHDTLPRRQRRAAPCRESVLGSLDGSLELCWRCFWAPRHHLLRCLAERHSTDDLSTAPCLALSNARSCALMKREKSTHRVCDINPSVSLTLLKLSVDQKPRCCLPSEANARSARTLL